MQRDEVYATPTNTLTGKVLKVLHTRTDGEVDDFTRKEAKRFRRHK